MEEDLDETRWTPSIPSGQRAEQYEMPASEVVAWAKARGTTTRRLCSRSSTRRRRRREASRWPNWPQRAGGRRALPDGEEADDEEDDAPARPSARAEEGAVRARRAARPRAGRSAGKRPGKKPRAADRRWGRLAVRATRAAGPSRTPVKAGAAPRRRPAHEPAVRPHAPHLAQVSSLRRRDHHRIWTGSSSVNRAPSRCRLPGG